MKDKCSVSNLKVMKSNAGYYIGTSYWDASVQYDVPYSRDSVEYYTTYEEAVYALEHNSYTPKINP